MEQQFVQNIVKASGVTAGELVLVHFWGEDADKRFADQFTAAVAARGASPVLLQQSRAANQKLFGTADPAAFDETYFSQFDRFDAVLDLFAQRPVVLGYDLAAEQYELYRRYIRHLFGKLMQCKRFTQIRLPTAANAEESGLEPAEFIRRLTAAYAVDYDRLRQDCETAKAQAERHSHAVLYTGQGHTLQFDLTGRPWHVDAGDGDWPCGEIYIAPRENATHGSVYYDTLYWEELGRFEQVTLFVQDGRAVGSDHAEVDAFLKAQPPENTVIGELGLGFNPGVQSLCGYTVLDEKMAGTFHIALGANHMFGGSNKAALHTDLVGSGRLEFTT